MPLPNIFFESCVEWFLVSILSTRQVNDDWTQSVRSIWNLFKDAVDTVQRIMFIVAILTVAYPLVMEDILWRTQLMTGFNKMWLEEISKSPWSYFSQAILIVTSIMVLCYLIVTLAIIVNRKKSLRHVLSF